MSTVNEVGRYQGRRPRSRAGAGLSGREAMLLLIPAFLPIVILSVIPLGRGIYLGFTDSQAGLNFDTNFIGLDNFRTLIHDDLFINSFKIGLIWSVTVTAIGFCFALGLALLLSQDLHGRWLARSLALVGMDNCDLSALTWPALTTVDLGSSERARLAAMLLLARIEQPDREVQVVGVEPRLVVRDSSGASA